MQRTGRVSLFCKLLFTFFLGLKSASQPCPFSIKGTSKDVGSFNIWGMGQIGEKGVKTSSVNYLTAG